MGLTNTEEARKYARIYQRNRVKNYKKLGLCERCGKTPVLNKTECDKCIEKRKNKRIAKTLNGVCHCGKPTTNGQYSCDSCLKLKQNRRVGKCDCGRILTNGKTRCSNCLKSLKLKRTNRKVNGLCVMCGQKAIVDKNLCIKCSESGRIIKQKARLQRKLSIQQHYGGKCKRCGETNPDLLCLDHIDNNGTEHRRQIGGSSKMYAFVIKNNFPKNFRLLCWKCNRLEYLEYKQLSMSPDEKKKSNKYFEFKRQIFQRYGGDKCKVCGEVDVRALVLDHIDGNGNKHRKDNNIKGFDDMFKWVCKNNYPPLFQVLCWNCNALKMFKERGYASINALGI